MDFFETVKNRHSIRAFKNKGIEEEKITRLLETANLAPSAGNLQAYEIVLINENNQKKALSSAAWGQDFIVQAPLVLVFCANLIRSAIKYGDRGKNLYALQDAAISTAYVQLAAVALGLSSVWVGSFNDQRVKEIINSPAHIIPIAILPIGYADESPRTKPRRKINELVHKEKL
jgi:nitroreductase